MGCITFVLLVLNIIALVAIDIMFWAESARSEERRVGKEC